MRETVITDAVIANPKSHYGDAKASTRHFFAQRVTGAINIIFLGFLLFIVVRVAGQDRADLVSVLGTAFVALPFAVLIGIVAYHMRNGMRDTLEDYTTGRIFRLAMSLNSFYCLVIAVVGIGAVLKIAFWG
jgi:succinate dehydrogenase / fumarate reductase membrane anchor subunit